MGCNRSIIIVILSIVFILFSGMISADSALVLEIPAEVVVSGLRFSLGDLGEIRGGSEADRKLIDDIKLGTVPPPGQVRVFSRKYLQLIVERYRLGQILELKMGSQVTVRADATRILDTDLDKAICKLITADGSFVVERWVELRNLPREIWLPKGNWQVNAEPIGELPLVGSALFKVTLSNGMESKSINVSGKIRAKALVYQAKHDVPRHALLTPADFQQMAAELQTGEELLGGFPERIRTTTVLKEGEVLQKKQIEQAPLVTKGGKVTVLIKGNGFEISITGIAGVDGWLGDMVTVKNSVSKKIFKGRVIGVNTVEVTVL